MEELKFYTVDENYLNVLRELQSGIPNIKYKSGNKKFFCGIVMRVNNFDYYVPVSSKINVTKNLNFVVAKKNNKNFYFSLRFPFMFPVPKDKVFELNIDKDIKDSLYKNLLWREIIHCNKNKVIIKKMAKKIYFLKAENLNTKLANKCLDFKLLEKKCLEYENSCEINKQENFIKFKPKPM